MFSSVGNVLSVKKIADTLTSNGRSISVHTVESYLDSLVESFNNKFLVKFSNDIPDIDVQEYYSSSSIAVTSKILIDSAIKFYGENLIATKTEEIIQEEVIENEKTVRLCRTVFCCQNTASVV